MSTSNIEWTNDTPNPVVGCTKCSAGCEDCYAIRMAWRLMHSPHKKIAEKYAGTVQRTAAGNLNWTGRINIDHMAMARVLREKNPKMYFVNSMGDLFHPNVSFRDIDIVFAAMAIAQQHIFQILTKHPDRMLQWLDHVEFDRDTSARVKSLRWEYWGDERMLSAQFPLQHVWMGASVENQKEADNRLPHLKSVADHGWLTWVSNEPALGQVNWAGWEFIKWMVTGGESGPKARPMHPDWARQARDFCAANNIPFFFKQWGGWCEWVQGVNKNTKSVEMNISGYFLNDDQDFDTSEDVQLYKVGKHLSGRWLDGQLHDEYPKRNVCRSEKGGIL